jgi:thiamine transporter ThiT
MYHHPMNSLAALTRMRLLAYSALFGLLAIVVTTFEIPLPVGNPNFGSTPVTIAAVFLPWPVGVITGLLKGIGVSLWTGKAMIELPAGIGDALMALFANRLAKRTQKSVAAVAGQLSRYFFTAGMVALVIGALTPSEVPVPGVASSSSFAANLFTTWAAISYPALTLSILLNASASVVIILLVRRRLEDGQTGAC